MLDDLCQQLSERACELDHLGTWPVWQLGRCASFGVFRWFVPIEFGGEERNERSQLEGYLALSRACLTTAFVLTQWNSACKRIATSNCAALKGDLMPKLASGECFATVGISHLTTSRQHLARPAVAAKAIEDGGFELNGVTPWVTGGRTADLLVIGATLENGDQILCAIPGVRAGVVCGPGAKLLALTASCTDQVELNCVRVAKHEVIAGPSPGVLQSGAGGTSGGLQTSALAIGLAQAAVGYLLDQSLQRPSLSLVATKLNQDAKLLENCLLRLADGDAFMQPSELRQRANSLVLRATQAALGAAKGSGFLQSHKVSRWCREALFFLVWSCPQPILDANLCELAQLNGSD